MTTLQRKIELEYGKPFKEVMYLLYIEKHMTMKEISEQFDVSLRTIQRWIKECDIPIRKITWI